MERLFWGPKAEEYLMTLCVGERRNTLKGALVCSEAE